MPLYPESEDRLTSLLQATNPTLSNYTGLWRYFTPSRGENISPCQAHCPLQNSIPGWIEKVKEGDWLNAWEIIKDYNPFPALTGQVCYRFCQEECNRGYYDQAINIGDLEKEIGNWRLKNYTRINNKTAGQYKVAVVGSGPAGLAFAYYLNYLGFKTTVWEKEQSAGGLLSSGIPWYRLPREVLEEELKLLQQEGVEFYTGAEVGKDVSLDELRCDYRAVLLAVGAQRSRKLGVPGEDLPGVLSGLHFLRRINLGEEIKIPKQVAVVGGGNAALDAACVASLNGAEKVTLLYRRSREEMPAHSVEVEAAEKAGVELKFQVAVTEVQGQGKVEKLTIADTTAASRGEKVEIREGSQYQMDVDMFIVAAGQESTLDELLPDQEINVYRNQQQNKNGVLVLDEPGEKKGALLTAGDALTGASTVPQAIFGGRQAALAVVRLLRLEQNTGETCSPALPVNEPKETVKYESLNTFYHSRQDAQPAPLAEAERCFSCGWCNHCGVCWVFCPDMAVSTAEEEYQLILDYCKGCGICARECPAGALTMKEVDRDAENHNER